VAWTIALVGVVGTFGLNFPVVLTAMADTTFDSDAGLYGLFNVMLAVGSATGALIAGGRVHTRLRLLVAMAALFGLAQTAAALAPGLVVFLVALVAMGIVNLAFQAMANSSVQVWVEPAVRGRVMGLYMLAFTGGTPLGAPLIGWITTHAGPRVGMAVCGIVPLLAAVAVGVLMAVRQRREEAAALVAPVAAPATTPVDVRQAHCVPLRQRSGARWRSYWPAHRRSSHRRAEHRADPVEVGRAGPGAP
jgi:MFS family permease